MLLAATALGTAVLTSAKRSTPRQGELRTATYTYTGGVTDGKQNGYGVCRYTNGNTYYGYWNMGYKGPLAYAGWAKKDDVFPVLQETHGGRFVRAPKKLCKSE